MKHLYNHTPIKTNRVKRKRMPERYTPEIMLTERYRDNIKSRKQWSEYKHYRNKILELLYENTPIQIYRKYHLQKLKIFR